MGCGAGAETEDAPFLDEEPAEEHVDDHAAAAKDNVNRHGYIVCECSIVEDGEDKEECDLRKVGQERYSTCSQAEQPGMLEGECKLAWERVEGDDEELQERDEDARVGIFGGEVFCSDCVAVRGDQRRMLARSRAYLQHPPKTSASVVNQSDGDSIASRASPT